MSLKTSQYTSINTGFLNEIVDEVISHRKLERDRDRSRGRTRPEKVRTKYRRVGIIVSVGLGVNTHCQRFVMNGKEGRMVVSMRGQQKRHQCTLRCRPARPTRRELDMQESHTFSNGECSNDVNGSFISKNLVGRRSRYI